MCWRVLDRRRFDEFGAGSDPCDSRQHLLLFCRHDPHDVYDIGEDRRERPFRPIPSGKISWLLAAWLGVLHLLAGLALSYVAGSTIFEIGMLLTFTIILYDGGLKQTLLGPALMGLCRFFNVLIGIAGFVETKVDISRDMIPAVMVAACNGLYILGVTIVAKNEQGDSKRGTLGAGLIIMLLASIAHVVIVPNKLTLNFGLAVLLALAAVWRLLPIINAALSERTPAAVQRLVKWSLFGLIIMNGLTTMAHVGVVPGSIILALTIPAMLIGRRLYAT